MKSKKKGKRTQRARNTCDEVKWFNFPVTGILRRQGETERDRNSVWRKMSREFSQTD